MVTLRIERRRAGRKGRKASYGTVLRLTRRGKAGLNAIKLPARIRGRALRAGAYRLTAVATASGKTSRPLRRAFRVRAA